MDELTSEIPIPRRAPSIVCDDVDLILCDDIDLGEKFASECSYVAGDPINLRDPWGLAAQEQGVGADDTEECTNQAGKKQACWKEDPPPAPPPSPPPPRDSGDDRCDEGCQNKRELEARRREERDERLRKQMDAADAKNAAFLDTIGASGFVVDDRTPKAKDLIGTGLNSGFTVQELPEELSKAGIGGAFDEERFILKLPRFGLHTPFERLMITLHELAHLRQVRGGYSSADLFKKNPNREDFVRAYVLREVSAEAEALAAGYEVLAANNAFDTPMSDRLRFDLRLDGKPVGDRNNMDYWNAVAYENTFGPRSGERKQWYEKRANTEYERHAGGP